MFCQVANTVMKGRTQCRSFDGNFPAGMILQFLRLISWESDRPGDFPSERNNGVYFPLRKIPPAIKDSANAWQTGELSGPSGLGVCAVEISVARKCHSEENISIF
jgi:hypothetical protein